MTVQPYGGAYPMQHQPLTDQRHGNTAEVICAWLLTVVSFGYMLPWAIAATRGKSNSLAVALVDLFAGWTLLGWVAALIMACTAHQQVHPHVTVYAQATAAVITPPAGWYPDPHAAGGVPAQRYWDGQVWTEHRA